MRYLCVIQFQARLSPNIAMFYYNFLSKEDNFCYFLFVYVDDITLSKKVLLSELNFKRREITMKISKSLFLKIPIHLNPIALRMAKTLWSFGHSECNRFNIPHTNHSCSLVMSWNQMVLGLLEFVAHLQVV